MNLKIISALLIGAVITVLGGCAPEVGSDTWCQKMEDTPTGDWTGNQATDYARHCLLK